VCRQPATSGVEVDANEDNLLRKIHDDIEQSFHKTGSMQPSTAASAAAIALDTELPLPSEWVSKWVDYSNKYGLGYLLSNNSCGVYFNDSSKVIIKHVLVVLLP
jgi:polo-like kinase 1